MLPNLYFVAHNHQWKVVAAVNIEGVRKKDIIYIYFFLKHYLMVILATKYLKYLQKWEQSAGKNTSINQ